MTDQDTSDINRVSGTTPDFKTELAKQLQELAPEAITDGKVDTQKLKELLDGDYADDSERFGLFWPGKKRAMRAAQEPTTATLKPAKKESKDWDTTENMFIEGDNLEVLKILQKYYHNKVKMIYIDPPYNTGKDFVYPDNYKEGLASYLEFTNQVDSEGRKVSTNSDTDGRYHSNWLNMMYPRLKLARNLLTDDGVIFLSIDDNEFSNLRKLCDEVFGEDNLIAELVVARAEGGGLAKQVIKGHDYLLAFARNIQKFSPLLRPKDIRGKIVVIDDEEYWIEEDWLRMEFGKYGTCTYEDIEKYFDLKKKEDIDAGLAAGKYVLLDKNGKTIVGRYRKVSEDGSKFYSILKHLNKKGVDDIASLEMNTLFDFPKPVSLLKDIILGATFTSKSESNIILDFFSGSGTTADAVMQLNAEDGGNRVHIQVQLPEPTEEKTEAYKAGYKTIADISKERIRRAGEKVKTVYADKIVERSVPLDTGFKVFKLADSNFTKWQSESDTDKDSLQQHLLDIRESSNDSATEEDLLTEVLLKQGISLTAKVKHGEVAGLSTWTIGDNLVVAYLNENVKPTLDQLRTITDSEPAKFIILEDAFRGDDELKTNLTQICKTKKIELWTV